MMKRLVNGKVSRHEEMIVTMHADLKTILHLTGTAKGGIPLIPKPSWSATFEKTSYGSHWVIDAGYGIITEHTWTVEGSSGDEVCYVTE